MTEKVRVPRGDREENHRLKVFRLRGGIMRCPDKNPGSGQYPAAAPRKRDKRGPFRGTK